MQSCGTREEAGAFVPTSIASGPLMSMIILGAAGSAPFEPQIFIGAVLPFLVGFALGNTIDLATLLSPLAAPGVVLALSAIVLTAIPPIQADRIVGGGTGTRPCWWPSASW